MTTVHPRRALAEAEAAAWLELHADWCRGLPAEVPDVRVRGQLFHDCLGDGWDTLWWHTAGRPEAPSVTPTPAPVRCRPDSDYDQQVPTLERRRLLAGPAFCLAPSHESFDQDSARWGLGARRSATVQMERRGHLSDSTVTLGQSVPRDLLYDVAADCAIRRTTRVVRASALDSVPDAPARQSSWAADLAAAELLQWLQADAGLTTLEAEALQRRAAGLAVPDRHCLARAQRRAAEALRPSAQEERAAAEPDRRPLPATGADFGCSPLRALALLEEEGWQRQVRRPLLTPYEPASDWLTAAYCR